MSKRDTDDAPVAEQKIAKGMDTFTVRQSLGSVEAMKKYDKYLKEHRWRLRQLEKVARGELSPGGDWYREE